MFITMPQLGETVTEGTIVHWYKAVGDEVAEDEALFEVSTDKVDTEVPSAITGVITQILVAEGETVPIGAQLAVVETDGDAASVERRDGDAPAHAPGGERPAPLPTAPAAPAAARSVEPDGRGAPVVAPGGLVSRADVGRRLAARDQPLARPAAADAGPAAGERRRDLPPVPVGDDDEVVPFTAIRRRTGAHTRDSIARAAHTLVVMAVDYLHVDRARVAVQDEFRAAEGFGLTYLPFVARAVIDALRDYPLVNASVGDGALIVHPVVRLGIAVDLDFEGLIVPIVSDAAELRLRPLARAIHERSAAARAGRLVPDDVTGGTFTITNAGGYGTLVTAPIISQPQVAIISTDGVAMRPVAVPTDEGHGIAVHPVGNLSLSFDHRAFDGAYASAFLRRVVETLETRAWDDELA